MVSRFLIYGLIDPRTGELRYIGQSSSGTLRARQHTKPSIFKHKNKKSSWVKSLIGKGLTPIVEILEEFETSDQLDSAEMFWIASIKAAGGELLNMTDGGKGIIGYIRTPEHCAKISAAKKGIKLSEDHKRRISEGRAELNNSPKAIELNRRNAKSNGGKPFKDQNGNLYFTVPEAAKILGLDDSTIRRSLKGYSSNKNFQYIEMEN